MAQKTLLPSQKSAVLAAIDPDNYSASTVTTDWVSMANFQALMAVISAGDLGTNATLDAKIEQAKDDSGTDAKDLDGAAITQLTQAGDDDSNKQAILQCYAEDLDLENEFTHVRLSMTIGTAASDAAGLLMGMSSRYQPASKYDADSVAEIVSL